MERSLDRLRWKCRRGLLELDLVLQRFMDHRFKGEDLEPLDALLDLPDNDLWDILSGRSENYEDRFSGIVARLRAA